MFFILCFPRELDSLLDLSHRLLAVILKKKDCFLMPVGEKKKQFSIVHLTPSFASICFDIVGVEGGTGWDC